MSTLVSGLFLVHFLLVLLQYDDEQLEDDPFHCHYLLYCNENGKGKIDFCFVFMNLWHLGVIHLEGRKNLSWNAALLLLNDCFNLQ